MFHKVLELFSTNDRETLLCHQCLENLELMKSGEKDITSILNCPVCFPISFPYTLDENINNY